MNIKILTISILSIALFLSYQVLRPSISNHMKVSSIKAENKTTADFQRVNTDQSWPAEIQAIIKKLRSTHADTIHLIHIQAKLISIRQPLINKLPRPINENLNSVLAVAFPGYENSILDVWSKMDQYEKWLTIQNRTLMELNAISRSEFLWDKRNDLFPKSAANIWSEKQDQFEMAQLNLHSEIDALDTSTGIPMSERIERLENSIQQADNLFTNSLEKTTGIHKNTIASVLFGLTSVQTELQQLDPEHRQLEIDSVRRELGYDEDSIAKMSKLDEDREQRWSNGYAYMESREQLLAINDQLSPDQLDQLRSEFFGRSAETIAREEAQGFYRFQRPRYYGRN